MGSFEWLDQVQPHRIDPEHFVSEISKAETPRLPPPLPPDRLTEFLQDLKLTVPEDERDAYLKLLTRNHDVFSKSKSDLGLANNFEHEIKLRTLDPTYIKQFRIPEAHREAVETQVKEWLKMGLIEPANSRYNSPIFAVPKKDGSLRFVLDFRSWILDFGS